MRVLRLFLLLPICVPLAGCAWLSQTSASAGDSLSAAATATIETLNRLLKTTPYDAPGTSALELSPEVSVALAGMDRTADPALPEPEGDTRLERDIRLYRIEQALAVARSDYDRTWLHLERGQTLAMLGRCAEARSEFAQLMSLPATPAVERLAADVVLRRIGLGVCWSAQAWTGYRYRPAPSYPMRTGHPPIEGEVEVLLHVNHRGGVADAVAIRSTHKVLELQTLLKVREWHFRPLAVDGVRIPFTLRQKLRFRHPYIYVDD